jgi:Holliday junction resolvase
MPSIFARRGYAFETALVATFNDFENGWFARRLGGTSSGMSDVLITNNRRDIIYSVECKSTYSDKAFIGSIQMDRTIEMLNMFSIYRNAYPVFAFKFQTKKPRSYHYFVFNITRIDNVKTFICNRDGSLKITPREKDKPYYVWFVKYDSLKDFKDDKAGQTMMYKDKKILLLH